ncbi:MULTISPECIES: cation/acetate symporter ActP [Bradyrhizobium]|uniref:Cation/acetate symporter ActP n=1 Tax=Bradyrhizobium elkanii TaxID=29448 RepID=A0A4U6RUU7_BRAEL|nr:MULTISPECIES: cation/acetate symporter ActP [Bradyrhizobium]MTV12989.1 cation/acetate symporter ActP [Bradyrhizobium sp. BR2003]TKV78824.1 cation/acetate symporter ActP [Bradyrhizobium elkanii]
MGSSTLSIGFFFAFMALTLAITYWAARRTRTTEHFFAAGGQVTPWQNGWALAGDFLSAAALLGIAGIVTSNGFDGMIYSIGWLVGWPIILFLIVEPLRNVGRFTFADVVAYRLRQRPVRLAGAIGTLAVILFYLIAQMVATGSLIKLLFGLPYTWSVIVVGSVMLVYVLFGGMLATTWVQVVKAVLLMGGGILLAFLVLTHFDMNPLKLFAAASEKYGTKVLQPGSKVVSGQWDAISLGLGLMFGTAAMPHVLMRAYTVKDSKAARLSILYATGLIGVFHLMVFIIGFGAMVLVGPEAVAKAGGGGNMAAPLLALVVGGNAFFGFICAVAFATMLAVVAGLTLSGVATLCHDVWTNVIRNGTASETEQLKVARVATVLISILAIGLGIAFEGQNVAFMAGLAFSIACAANFPSLVLAITWRHFTTPAAVASILVGTLSSLVLIYLSPTIQVDILGKPLAAVEHQWWFVSLRNPAIISMPLSFAVAILLSLVTREKNANLAFDEMQRRILLGPIQPNTNEQAQAKNAA